LFNFKQFGIKKVVIRKGEDLEEIKQIVDQNPNLVIISVYLFETEQHRNTIYEMFKQALTMVK